MDGGRKVAASGAVETGGIVPKAAHHLPGALAGGVVDFRDGCESREAQYLRFSESGSPDLRAGAFFGQGSGATPRAAHWQMGDPAVAADGRNAEEERAVLEDSRSARSRQHYPTRSRDLPSRRLQRPSAVRSVDAGSARFARDVLFVYPSRGRVGRSRRLRADPVSHIRLSS